MILAEKIMKLRKQQGWSQEELAMKLGVSRQSVSKWESGASIPELDKILQLGELFGVSTDFLLKDDREDFPIINGDEDEQRQNGAETWEREQRLRQVTLEEADTLYEADPEGSLSDGSRRQRLYSGAHSTDRAWRHGGVRENCNV